MLSTIFISMDRSEVFELITKERKRQNHEHMRPDGSWPDHRDTKLRILAEEFGEVAKALNDEDWPNLMEELIQTAAVCTAWVEDEY